MANIGRLTVDLRLTSQKFTAGLKKATGSLNTFRAKAQTATSSMVGMQAKLGALVGVAGFGAMISQSLKAGDAIAKMSDRLGISTENLAAFQHLAQLNGESIEGFDKSIEKMTRSIGEAQRGLGTGKKAFEDLGLSVDAFTGKSPDEQFLIIGEAIKGVGDKTLQASYASDIFGRSGIKLLNTLNQGREGFKNAVSEVNEYGLALNRVDGAKIEAANDAILRSQQVIKGASLAATVELAPIIEEVSNQFINAGTEGEGFAGKIKDAIRGAVGFIGVFADGIRGIKVILKSVETAVKGQGLVFAESFRFIVNDVLVPFENHVRNFVLAPLREILEFGAQFSTTAQSMLDGINQLGNAEGFKVLTNIAGAMRDSFNESKEELQTLMLETIPSEAMISKIDDVYSVAKEKAEKLADDVKQTAEKTAKETSAPQSEGEDLDSKEQKKKSYLDRMANLEVANSRKVARIKQGIKLKEVLANTYKSISEAVASAPFPANIPAIAFATAESAVALAGVKSAGSFEGGGFTGTGARVGGIDGRGGMPATVHPNEQIIDLSKPASRSASQSITINLSPMGGGDQGYWNGQAKMIQKAINREALR